MGHVWGVCNDSPLSMCGAKYRHRPTNTHTQTGPLTPVLARWNWFDWPLAPQQRPTCRGQWSVDLWHNMAAHESSGSPSGISRGPPSNRILAEVSTLEAVTCPSDIPVDTLCCHEYYHEYSTLAFFLFWWSLERECSTGCSSSLT